jgi:hypothetical protein
VSLTERAFEELYSQTRQALMRHVRGKRRHAMDADDIVQEAFYHLWRIDIGSPSTTEADAIYMVLPAIWSSTVGVARNERSACGEGRQPSVGQSRSGVTTSRRRWRNSARENVIYCGSHTSRAIRTRTSRKRSTYRSSASGGCCSGLAPAYVIG